MPDAIAQVFDRVGGSQRVLTLLVGLGALAAIWGFVHWGMSPAWIPVADGMPIERMSDASQRLDEAGIAYRLERGGSVLAVQDRDMARARVVLAAEGLTGVSARPGFELFDQPSWGMTDFTQRVNYRRALEGELERTIGQMRGVESAQVHLALQESSFLDASTGGSEASVVVRRRAGGRADESVVEGIQSLVASSVEGLERDDVTVLDDRGRLLSTPEGQGGAGLTSRQLQVRRQIEGYLESKAQAVVEQIVGPGSATVRVAADLNFDRVDRTVETLDLDQQVTVSEDRAEITPGSQEQGAGSVTTTTVYQTPRSTETLSRGGARLERLTVAVVLADRRVEAADGGVTFEPRGAREVQRVQTLVANAVGISPERGDQISVVSAPPEEAPEVAVPEDGFDVVGTLQVMQRPAIALAGVLMAFFLALKLMGNLKGMRPPRPVQRMPAPAEALLPTPPQAEIAGITAPQRQEPAFELADPEMTARVVRAWMKEA